MRDGTGRPSNPVRLAPADVQIIRCLNEDARSPVAKIADQLRMPESTVRHRLNRLIRHGLVEFTAVPNPLHLGYQIWAIIEIQAELPKIRTVAQRLAAAPEVYFVGITTGGYDILAGAVFRSNDELLDFITQSLAQTPGIVRTSTSSVLEVVKRSLTFAAPQQDGAARAVHAAGRAVRRRRRVSRRRDTAP